MTTWKRKEIIGDCTLYLGDCEQIMPELGTFDAVVTDPPYFQVKQDQWDNQWKNKDLFLLWVKNISDLIFSKMKNNSSLFWFSSPQMAANIEVILSDKFNILNNMVWSKSERLGSCGSGIDVGALRKFWTANSERIIFAETKNGNSEIEYEKELKKKIFGDFIQERIKNLSVSNSYLAKFFLSKNNKKTGCVSNWINGDNLPTKEQFNIIVDVLKCNKNTNYDDLLAEYESKKRPFFADKISTFCDVWQHKIERNTQHPTQKPLDLMVDIILVSTKEGNSVFDPFMGSGTTGVACVKQGRKFTGIEQIEEYFDIACERICKAYEQPDMLIEAAKQPEPQQQALFDEAAQ